MRYRLILHLALLALAIPAGLAAQENYLSLRIWPDSLLPVDGLMLFTGEGTAADDLLEIERFRLRLVSTRDTVPLAIDRLYSTRPYFAQVLAKPDRNLIAGERYRLEGDGFNYYLDDRAWICTGDDAVERPEWPAEPIHAGGSYLSDDKRYVYLAFPEFADTNVLIEATLVRVDGGGTMPQGVVLQPRETIATMWKQAELEPMMVASDGVGSTERVAIPGMRILAVGDGYAGGGLLFNDPATYRLSLTLVNASGVRSEKQIVGYVVLSLAGYGKDAIAVSRSDNHGSQTERIPDHGGKWVEMGSGVEREGTSRPNRDEDVHVPVEIYNDQLPRAQPTTVADPPAAYSIPFYVTTLEEAMRR